MSSNSTEYLQQSKVSLQSVRTSLAVPGGVVGSPHQEQFGQDHQEGVPHPGGHLVGCRGPVTGTRQSLSN